MVGANKKTISLLNEAISCLSKGRAECLSDISDRLVKEASIFQEAHITNVTIIIFAIYKIFDRRGYDKRTAMTFSKMLRQLVEELKADDLEHTSVTIHALLAYISEQDNRLKIFIDEIIEKAYIKKGSQMHGHGVSLGQAAHVMGLSHWELASYIGKTKIADTGPIDIKQAKNRLQFARGLFS